MSEVVSSPTPDLGSRAVLNTAFVLAARIASRLAALVLVLVLANHLGATRAEGIGSGDGGPLKVTDACGGGGCVACWWQMPPSSR